MSGFSEKERELLHQLFSPKTINKLLQLFPQSSEFQWLSIYRKILSEGPCDEIQSSDLLSRTFGTVQKSESDVNLILYVDGASDMENGRAGIGGIFYLAGKSNDEKKELYSFSEYIGKATNNEAEYRAFIRGLEFGQQLNGRDISIFSDSELLVKQINLEYQVKNKRLQKLYREAKELLTMFHSWKINHIPREQNKIADILSKQGLNNI